MYGRGGKAIASDEKKFQLSKYEEIIPDSIMESLYDIVMFNYTQR